MPDYMQEKSKQSALEEQIDAREKARNQGVLEETPGELLNQKYQQEKERLDEARNVGVILDVAPEELTKRAEDTFDGSEESLYAYFGASEPIKIDSESEEFEIFCREFFYDCTGKYALVYIGNNSQEDYENQLCIKFLGF